MRRRGFPEAHAAVPNLAPMVDVVMVILIFFMLGTSFAMTEGALPTQLPSRVGPGGTTAVTIVPAVRIALQETADPDECHILLMERDLPEDTFEALHSVLISHRQAGADPNGRILIGAEPGVQYEHVISAMDACVRAGFGNIQFSVSSGAMSPATVRPAREGGAS